MSADLRQRIEKIRDDLWRLDGPDDWIEEVAQELSRLKFQADIQKSLQATANLLRHHPPEKALPNQRATGVKHFLHFIFRKDRKTEGRGKDRNKQLRNLSCDTLKFWGLTYRPEAIVKMDKEEFEILLGRGAEFLQGRELSGLLNRKDVDKAASTRLTDVDDELYEKFLQDHLTQRWVTEPLIRKRPEGVGSDASASKQAKRKRPDRNRLERVGASPKPVKLHDQDSEDRSAGREPTTPDGRNACPQTEVISTLHTQSKPQDGPTTYDTFQVSGRSQIAPPNAGGYLNASVLLPRGPSTLMSATMMHAPRPQLQLALRRRVPDTAQSIAFAMNGDTDGLKSLFSLGLASPRDESESRGFSLIRWALYGGMHNYKTVQFLIGQGAYVDDESYEHVWDYRFRGKCSAMEQETLRCITERRDRHWFDEQNFPLVHKIIFGLSSKSLTDELVENPNAVSITDAQGRTALDWATSRAQLADMTLLIACGSDPNTMDVTGRTTVLHAVDSHNVQALRIILEAGADPDPQMPNGLFRSSPVTAASFGGLAEMIELLVQFNAKIDADNPEGRTALQTVVVTQNVECAAILLRYGADMHHVSSNGCTPLMTAIIHNKHEMLRVFLGHTGRHWGSQLLPIIAQHADSETMSILASTGHTTLDLPYIF